MNLTSKYSLLMVLFLGLTACGGDDDDDRDVNEPPAEPMTIVDVAVEAGDFTTLITALEATGLDETLDDPDATYTVFAPTDAAFEMLGTETIDNLLADTETLSDILLYHVVVDAELDAEAAIAAAGTTVETANGDKIGLSLEGESLLVNLAMVTTTDIEADNGVIHVIDAVLMPPAEPGEPVNNIVETAMADEQFSTLVTALQSTGLDATLANEDETFTVFAPTNEAFDALGEETMNGLLADTEALEAILLQHVVSGAAVTSVDAYAANGTSVTTAGGVEVPVDIDGDSLIVGGATVVMSDVYTTNGVIHVIDAVIVEPGE